MFLPWKENQFMASSYYIAITTVNKTIMIGSINGQGNVTCDSSNRNNSSQLFRHIHHNITLFMFQEVL